jgi:hypothetical protein
MTSANLFSCEVVSDRATGEGRLNVRNWFSLSSRIVVRGFIFGFRGLDSLHQLEKSGLLASISKTGVAVARKREVVEFLWAGTAFMAMVFFLAAGVFGNVDTHYGWFGRIGM